MTTGALVPIAPLLLGHGGVYSAKPVRGGASQWAAYAQYANHLLGRGGALIPHAMVAQTLTGGATETLRFKVFPRYACRRRLWFSTYQGASKAAVAGTVTFTDPSAGTSVARFSIAANGSYVHVHVEDVAAPSASETAIAPTWALAASPTGVPVLLHVACYEIPRTELALDANEYGVDLTSCYAGRPIYTTTGKGIGAVSTAVQQAQTVAQRAGAFHFARDTGEALSTTAAAYTPVFLADSVPVHLGRKLYTTSTVRTLQVRAYCRAGATTVGKLRFTMTSGDSVVLDITSGMAAAWLTGELDVDCEDLSVSDGRRSARDDKCTIDWYRVSGANSVYIESISIGNG